MTEPITQRLVLRPLRLSDAPAMYAYRSDPEVSRFQLWEPQDVEEIRAFIGKLLELEPDTPGTWYQLAITLKEKGVLIGDLGLHFPIEPMQAEVGITLDPAYQGQGYATEALEGALAYLFVDLGKHRVYGRVDPRNEASIRLLERVGMRKEGHLREAVWANGEWTDDAIYGILEQEWRSPYARKKESGNRKTQLGNHLPQMSSKDIVRNGYDAVSYTYRGDVEDGGCAQYHQWLDELIPFLTPGTRVLDLGCGCGIPVARRLAATYPVTGVDISPVQIERARQLVPQGHFLGADIMDVAFPPAHFGAIVSFYAIIHVPLEEQPGLFQKMKRWMVPGGYLMMTVGCTEWTGTEDNWLGVPDATMYWSHTDATTYESWLVENDFTICWTRFIPEGDDGHTLILARKRSE